MFSGVESSLCNLMDVFKFALVIILPSPELHFGYLVIISFSSVFIGWFIFVVFVRNDYKIKRIKGRVEQNQGNVEELEILNKVDDKEYVENGRESYIIKS